MPVHFLKKPSEVLPVKNMQYLLHSHLHGREPHRGSKTIHASALTKEDPTAIFCPREVALSDLTKKKQTDGWISTSEQVTFGIGHALQALVVGWFADMNRAIGHWRCLACNHLHEFQNRPIKCDHRDPGAGICGCRAFEAEEVRFTSALNGASCGIDMLFNNGSPKLRIAEIKTMAPDEFKKLMAPLAEHRIRTALYLRIVEESNTYWKKRIDTSCAEVLYVSKGGYGVQDLGLKKWGLPETFSPFKHFIIKRDHKSVDEHAEQARKVFAFRNGTEPIPVGICEIPMLKRAQACGMVKACFSGDFPSGSMCHS